MARHRHLKLNNKCLYQTKKSQLPSQTNLVLLALSQSTTTQHRLHSTDYTAPYYTAQTTQHRLHATLHVVYDESEHVVLYEEGAVGRLEDERLREAVRRVFIHLQLPEHIDDNTTVERWLAVNGGDASPDGLESEALYFFQNGLRSLHLHTLK